MINQIFKMIRTVIVDDEIFASDNLSKLLNLYCNDVSVVGTANSVDDAIQKITTLRPELVFLDVHLARDTSFSILKAFSEITFSIIFVSGYANYAIDAFKVSAIDYLLKPLDSDDLLTAMEKYRKWKSLNEKNAFSETSIRIHHKDTVSFIQSSSIIALIANDNYTTIISKDEQKYTAAKTLKEFEETLSSSKHFIRIHRSILVNIHFVETYSKTAPYTIKMKNGEEYEISRRKRSEIIGFLTSQ